MSVDKISPNPVMILARLNRSGRYRWNFEFQLRLSRVAVDAIIAAVLWLC